MRRFAKEGHVSSHVLRNSIIRFIRADDRKTTDYMMPMCCAITR